MVQAREMAGGAWPIIEVEDVLKEGVVVSDEFGGCFGDIKVGDVPELGKFLELREDGFWDEGVVDSIVGHSALGLLD